MLEHENYIEDDFQDFLEKRSFEESESSDIISEDLANYYVAKIKKNKKIQDMYEERAKNIITEYSDKVKLWKEKHINSLEEDTKYCLGKLKDYFDSVANDEDAKIRFPEGNLGFYKTRVSVKIDENEVLDFALNSVDNTDLDKSVFKDLLEYKPSVNKTSLRSIISLDAENGVAMINNVIIPGVKVSGGNKKFDVR